MDLHVTLTVIEGNDEGSSFELSCESTTIGRKKSDFALTDSKVSKLHAAVEMVGTELYAVDLGAKNGLFLNGEKIERSKLKNMDVLILGATKIRVMIVEDLEAFRRRNSPTEPGNKIAGSADIGTLIDDELKRFSKWDLSHTETGVEGDGNFAMGGVRCGIEILKGPDAGRRIRLSKSSTTVGRGGTDIVLNDEDVSRLHAQIEILSNGKVMLKDMGSANGTYIGSERVTETPWPPDEVVRIGRTLLRLVSRPT